MDSVDTKERRLFRALDANNDGAVTKGDVVRALSEVGLQPDDPRLAESMAALDEVTSANRREDEPAIGASSFAKAVRNNILLVERALQGRLVIPDFEDFCDDIDALYEISRNVSTGAPADYIPQLDLPASESDRFGIALCTIDGQRHAVGDAAIRFTVQSTSKPITYGLALEEHGAARVHKHVGYEPSGGSFNALTLDRHNRPHNPLINAGAIMSASMIKLSERTELRESGRLSELDNRGWSAKRLEYVMASWKALCGGAEPGFSSPVYLSERQTADRNYALAYFMRESGAFPDGVDLDDVLDFYFQLCSVELDAQMMSVAAATLANGGINPITGERVFGPETVRHILSLMSACGMYDYSGEFAFTIGLPAKSGVSGAIMIVIPNLMGICTYSPRLDENGNSVRGVDFCRRLVSIFNVHHFDNITGASDKSDPRNSGVERRAATVERLIWAASKGDLSAIQQEFWRGADLNSADYDKRTPLHLAAAEGREHVVRFFIEAESSVSHDVNLSPSDRWGGTPLDDARRHGHARIASLLEAAGGVSGTASGDDQITVGTVRDRVAILSTQMIWSASLGDLRGIRRLVARGLPLSGADYDLRTPLHLAAAEGHEDLVRYLLTQGVDSQPKDRWGGTPLDDAQRHGHERIVNLLKQSVATAA